MPFHQYLTIFQSRLGTVRLPLGVSSLAAQSEPVLTRRVKKALDKKISLSVTDAEASAVLEYLSEKRLAGNRRGRYRNLALDRVDGLWTAAIKGQPVDRIEVFLSDFWMADSGVRSTVGAPTLQTVGEFIELAMKLRLLHRTKLSWTPAAQLVEGLAGRFSGTKTPFRLGAAGLILMRQVFLTDGFMIRRIMEEIVAGGSTQIDRDRVSCRLPELAQSAANDAEDSQHLSYETRRSLKAHVQTLIDTRERSESKKGSRGPGVLEHRTVPRLEWLVDIGGLSKRELPRNGFTYRVETDAARLAGILESFNGQASTADVLAVRAWRELERWEAERRLLPELELHVALTEAYRLVRRSVGPSPIQEVALGASLFLRELEVPEIRDEIIAWSGRTKDVRISGSRYSREPSMVHIGNKTLTELQWQTDSN